MGRSTIGLSLSLVLVLSLFLFLSTLGITVDVTKSDYVRQAWPRPVALPRNPQKVGRNTRVLQAVRDVAAPKIGHLPMAAARGQQARLDLWDPTPCSPCSACLSGWISPGLLIWNHLRLPAWRRCFASIRGWEADLSRPRLIDIPAVLQPRLLRRWRRACAKDKLGECERLGTGFVGDVSFIITFGFRSNPTGTGRCSKGLTRDADPRRSTPATPDLLNRIGTCGHCP